MDSRRCQPPDRVLARCFATGCKPKVSSITAVRALAASLERPWIPARNSRFSVTDRLGAMAVSWGDTAMTRFTCSASVQMLRPSSFASPAVGRVRQESILMVVVFPAPLTPSRAKNSPCPMVRFKSSTAVRLP